MQTEAKKQNELLTKQASQLESLKKQLDSAPSFRTSPLKRKISSLAKENEELRTSYEKLAAKEQSSSKRAKKNYDKIKRSESPYGQMGIIPKDELKRMGLCRESLLSRDWHNLFPTKEES